MSTYNEEVQKRWGSTDTYAEFSEKTKGYSEDKFDEINAGLDKLMAEFGKCMAARQDADNKEAQDLVKKLQEYITQNYYTCTNEILAGLGKMYIADERFKNNIDKHGNGTAEYISKAIATYCAM